VSLLWSVLLGSILAETYGLDDILGRIETALERGREDVEPTRNERESRVANRLAVVLDEVIPTDTSIKEHASHCSGVKVRGAVGPRLLYFQLV
jgi:hypothetical protein